MNPESQSPLVASLERGVSVRMKIKVGLRTDGSDLDLPIFVVKGRHPGPVLWIQGCLHGDEYAGSRAIHHFINKINPEKLCGAIIAVPVVNILAWEQKRRVSYVDNLDLNRVFPGSAEKTWTHFLAFHLLETISQNAHYVIDLHGYRSSYFALCFRQEDEPGAFALELALASGSPVVVNVSETWLEHSLFAVLTRRGIPAIIIERVCQIIVSFVIILSINTAKNNASITSGNS